VTFTEIVERIAERLNIPPTATSSLARIGKAVNDVYREVTTSIGIDPSRRVVSATGTTALGIQTVTFNGIEKIERIVDDSSGSIKIIPEVTFEQIREINPGLSDNIRKWAVESWTGTSVTIRIDVLPQTVFNLKADGSATVATLDAADVPAFPESFHDILIDGVLAEEFMKQEKAGLSDRAQARFEKRLSDLRMWRAKSISMIIRGAENRSSTTGSGAGAGGGGSAPSGGTSYTQTGLITFNRGGSSPFAVISGAAMVGNLDAEFLQGMEPSDFATSFHGSTHASGGADELKLDDLATPDDNSDLNATTLNHGLLRKLDNNQTHWLRGDGNWWPVCTTNNNRVLYSLNGIPSDDGGFTFDPNIGNLTIPGQITFPSVQQASTDAHTLDDYEEGTWVPVIGGNSGTSGQSYTNQFGLYTKIGRLVTAEFHVLLSNKGTITGTLQLQGLPFAGNSMMNRGIAIRWIGTSTAYVSVMAIIGGSTSAELLGATAAATSLSTIATGDITSTTAFSGVLTYCV
jgi:hypothetical protein